MARISDSSSSMNFGPAPRSLPLRRELHRVRPRRGVVPRARADAQIQLASLGRLPLVLRADQERLSLLADPPDQLATDLARGDRNAAHPGPPRLLLIAIRARHVLPRRLGPQIHLPRGRDEQL